MAWKKFDFLHCWKNSGNGKQSVLEPDLPLSDLHLKPATIGYFQMFRYSTKIDKILLSIGILSKIAMAMINPLQNIFFLDLIQTMVDYANTKSTTADSTTIDLGTDEFLAGIRDFAINMGWLGILSLILGYIAIEAFNYTATKQIFRIRSIYTKRILNQDISWYDKHHTGNFATKISDDLIKIEEGLGDKVAVFLGMQVKCIASVILALVKGWKMALVCLTSLPLQLMCLSVILILSTKLAKNESDSYGAAGAIAEEVLRTIRTVLAFDGVKKETERYDNKLIQAKNNNILRNLLSGVGFGLLWFVIYISHAMTLWYGVSLIIDERDKSDPVYTPSNMITVFFSVMGACTNFGMSSTIVDIFARAKASATKIFSLIDTPPVINLSKEAGLKSVTLKGHIEFKDVHFSYPTRRDVPVLTGLSLSIEAGRTVALVGSSGCGKTTCIQMLQRFYDPISGEITLDGNNLKDLNLKWYRQNIAVVGQEPILFGTTIEENIKYGNMEATVEDIIAATKRANAFDFISALPNGLNTIVGERGATLSGGQKQRIAIARALVKNPAVLLLDEATSALDTESESKVQAALDAASEERTTIIVAHRLSTIRNADKIIVISDGKVVEQGTHDELMALNQDYFSLVTHQLVEQNLGGKADDESENKENVILDESISELPTIKTGTLGLSENKYEEEDETRPISFMQIIRMNRPEWLSVLLGSMGAIVAGLTFPLISVLIGDIVAVLSKTNSEVMRRESSEYCYFFVIVGAIIGLGTTFQIYFFAYAGELLTFRLRSQLFTAMLRQEVGWYDRKENGVGALCSKLSCEAALVQGAIGQRLATILNSSTTLIFAICLAIYYSWKLGLVTMALLPFMLLAMFWQQRLIIGEDKSHLQAMKESTQVAMEAISNIRTVASLGAEDLFHCKFLKDLILQRQKMLRNSHVKGFVYGLSRSILFLAFATSIFYGGFLIVDGMPYDNVVKVCHALILSTFSLANILAFAPNLQKGVNAAKSSLKLLNRIPKIKENPNGSHSERKKGSVEYSQVYFAYPTRPKVQVLRYFNMSIFQGKTVALVGSSGCGKSTVIQLLERFYDPNSGSIKMDNEDIREMGISSLRSNLGIVSQEPNLFDKTIGENIAYGDNWRDVSQEEIIEAAKKANIHNFISSLPLGYDTRLGEKGKQISGGQKQRLAIARALIRNPKILLLDEATSSLDTESEKVVQEALDKAKEGRTCITIAHRLSTIQDADVICVINKGKVIELGNHAELMRNRGFYHQLYSLQIQ